LTMKVQLVEAAVDVLPRVLLEGCWKQAVVQGQGC
jgi:hypothetical protein